MRWSHSDILYFGEFVSSSATWLGTINRLHQIVLSVKHWFFWPDHWFSFLLFLFWRKQIVFQYQLEHHLKLGVAILLISFVMVSHSILSIIIFKSPESRVYILLVTLMHVDVFHPFSYWIAGTTTLDAHLISRRVENKAGARYCDDPPRQNVWEEQDSSDHKHNGLALLFGVHFLVISLALCSYTIASLDLPTFTS